VHTLAFHTLNHALIYLVVVVTIYVVVLIVRAVLNR
jgi:hypothetical protein